MSKLSIITINYNNVNGLKKTIESVLMQTYKDFEYIVIDGGSNDGSAELIQKHTSEISYWVSEKDKGIYNAMNKGIEVSKGEYLLFLNSGDILISNTILKKTILKLSGEAIVYGNGLINNFDGSKKKMVMPSFLSMEYFMRSSLFHPSTFIKKTLFEKYGNYNEENTIVSDWEFFIKTIIVNKISTKKIDLFMSEIEDGGISRDENNRQQLLKEISDTHVKYDVKSFLNNSELKNETNNGLVTKLLKLFK